MESRIVLITGCSSGIGQALAIEFKNQGWHVIATARNVERLKKLSEIGCKILELDVTKSDQIISVVDQISKEEGKIDMLINNAGYALIDPAIEINPEELNIQFATNFSGLIYLTQQVAKIMKQQKSGTIINIGSISGIVTMPFSGAYCATKAAVHAYSDALRMELSPFGIKVITVQPGAIESNFGNNADKTIGKVLNPESWYNEIEEFIHKRAQTSQQDTTKADIFAKKLIREIINPNPPAIVRLGKKSFLLPFLKSVLPLKLMDKILMKRFGLDKPFR